MYWWSREYPVTDAAKIAEVDENTAVDVYRWLREVCSTKLLATPILLGGQALWFKLTNHSFVTNQR